MDPDTLESTNQRLHDLERKLSLVLTSSLAYTAQSHGSVVQDPTHSGLARKNIQLLVLQYIKGNTSEFDADRVFSDRQHKFATTFGREYSPSPSNSALVDPSKNTVPVSSGPTHISGEYPGKSGSGPPSTFQKDPLAVLPRVDELSSNYASDDYGDYFDDDDFVSGGESEGEPAIYAGDSEGEYEYEYVDEEGEEEEVESDDESLLPPLPPRLPPREMDPTKLYGLFDFLGPDPLHCTLRRDEPVYLLNDLDNYWWLIRKLSKAERQALGHAHDSHTNEKNNSDYDYDYNPEDGKIGFVPAECLETYGERLARLNCFKNEELERFSGDTLPALADIADMAVSSKVSVDTTVNTSTKSGLARSSSILRKAGTYGQGNKLVTFENLGELRLEDGDDDSDYYSDDVIDFAASYYSVGHDDVAHKPSQSTETPSEVLSDIYPTEAPLQIRKPRAVGASREQSGFAGFAQPKMAFSGDNASIGSFSPDTPPTQQFTGTNTDDEEDDEGNRLRRSVILDRLNIVTLGIQAQNMDSGADSVHEPTFGGSLQLFIPSDDDSEGGSVYEQFYSGGNKNRPSVTNHGYTENEALDDQCSRKSLLAEEVSTPLTSVNSLNCVPSPKAPVPMVEKKRKRPVRPVHDMFMPILGQLDELTEKLAELEHIL